MFNDLMIVNDRQTWLLRNKNNNGYTTIFNNFFGKALDFADDGTISLNAVNDADSQMFTTTDGSSLINKKTKKYLADSDNNLVQSSPIVYLKLNNV